jgi:hypothetical protein
MRELLTLSRDMIDEMYQIASGSRLLIPQPIAPCPLDAVLMDNRNTHPGNVIFLHLIEQAGLERALLRDATCYKETMLNSVDAFSDIAFLFNIHRIFLLEYFSFLVAPLALLSCDKDSRQQSDPEDIK